MPGGRPRKPYKIRLLEGGRGKSRPMTPDLPAPESRLRPPKDLSKPERAAWKLHVARIRQLGLESDVDAGQVEALVRFYCRARAADKALAELGLVTVTEANGEIARPEVAISERCWKLYSQLATRFGLDPQARAKLGTGGPKPESASDLPEDLRDASGQ